MITLHYRKMLKHTGLNLVFFSGNDAYKIIRRGTTNMFISCTFLKLSCSLPTTIKHRTQNVTSTLVLNGTVIREKSPCLS